MAYRTAHGNAAAGGTLAVIETSPPDELPPGVPAPPKPEAERRANGTFTASEASRAVAARGGKKAHESRKFRQLLGLVNLDENHPYQPYLRLAIEHRADHCRELAETVGGGRLSPGTASIVASASMFMAASRYLHDIGVQNQDPKLIALASNMADKSRTALITAHELAAREAIGRKGNDKPDQVGDLARALEAKR